MSKHRHQMKARKRARERHSSKSIWLSMIEIGLSFSLGSDRVKRIESRIISNNIGLLLMRTDRCLSLISERKIVLSPGRKRSFETSTHFFSSRSEWLIVSPEDYFHHLHKWCSIPIDKKILMWIDWMKINKKKKIKKKYQSNRIIFRHSWWLKWIKLNTWKKSHLE